MNGLLAEIMAGLIMLIYVYSIKYAAQGSFIAMCLSISWSFVLFILLWIMFYSNDEIIKKLNNQDRKIYKQKEVY